MVFCMSRLWPYALLLELLVLLVLLELLELLELLKSPPDRNA
jgi:hypothetical protein